MTIGCCFSFNIISTYSLSIVDMQEIIYSRSNFMQPFIFLEKNELLHQKTWNITSVHRSVIVPVKNESLHQQSMKPIRVPTKRIDKNSPHYYFVFILYLHLPTMRAPKYREQPYTTLETY